MMEGLTSIQSKLAALTSRNQEGFSQGFSLPFTPTTFLAELLEKLRTLDGQLIGVLLGQLPSASTDLMNLPILSLQNPALPSLNASIGTYSASRQPANLQFETVGMTTEIANLANESLDKVAVQQLVIQTARRYSVEPALALAVAKAESDFDPNAVSPKGATGVMQLMPETAKSLGVSNPFDPVQNIDGGIRYLKQLIEQFSGNVTLAVAAYNAGPSAVRRYGGVPPYPETQNFVKRVLAYRKAFQKELPSVAQTVFAEEQTKVNQTFNPSNRFHLQSQSLLSELKSVTAVNKATPTTGNTAMDKASFSQTPDLAQMVLKQEPAQNMSETTTFSTLERSQIQLTLDREVAQSLSVSEFTLKVEQEEAQVRWAQEAGQKLMRPELQSLWDLTPKDGHSANSLQTLNGQVATSNSQLPQHLEAPSQQNSPSALPTRLPENTQAVVKRLTVEVPVAEGGEWVKLQVSLPNKMTEIPTVQVSVKVGNEQLATQLAQQFPSLRQHLWEQGIVLAQWTVASGWWEGGRRDLAEYFGDWRRLPSASHNRLPTDFFTSEGIWA